jgi:hypothetical protein
MIAHHPETGQPIRILTSDAQVSQSHRTLVWLQPTYQGKRWNRWTTLVSDPESFEYGLTQHIVVQSVKEWIPVLRNSKCVVWSSQAAAEECAEAGIDTSAFLIWEDLFSMYPFLGEPVHASDPIEKVVISIAHILRFRTLAGTFSLEHFGVKSQLNAWSNTCQGSILSLAADAADTIVPECWLIQQYYNPSQSRRAREINLCLEKNIENPLIDRILLLNEATTEVPQRFRVNKVQIETIEGRMTYASALKAIQTHCPLSAFAMFSNSDIWFDKSLAVLWSIPLAERRLFLALLRWDGEEPTLFGPRSDSQDSWIVARSTLDFEVQEEEFGFPFGKPGCDNAISVAMLRKKCLVVNPAYSIITHHVHASNIRTYDPRDILYKPMYLYVDPTPIQLSAVEQHLKPWKKDVRAWKASAPCYSFFHELKGASEEDLQTISTTLRQKEELALEPNTVQTWTPPGGPETLYEWSHAFVSPQGLVSNFRSIFVGDSEVWRTGWASAEISSLTPAVHIPELAMVYSSPEHWSSTAAWVMYVLPTILRIREAAGPLEFLVPSEKAVGEFLCDCKWKQDHVGTVPYMEDVQYYADRLVMPEPVKNRKITSEDVERLQALLPPVEKEPGLDVVICLDDVWTAGWWEELATCHAKLLRHARITCVGAEDSHTVRRAAFQKADWIFGSREALRWGWMSQAGTKWVEWMLETDITSEIYWLAGAAHCSYIPSLIRKEPIEFQRQRAILQFSAIWKKFAFKEVLRSLGVDKPTVYLPTGKALQGVGSHAVDAFREMVQLWKEREYCEVKYTEDSMYVWWGGLGDTLLYDWDTPRWWNPTTSYRLALFGNCPPPGPQGHEMRQSEWSFWPRSPRKLEAVVESGILPWKDRSISSIFLGKVENGVQKAKRCKVDWSTAVEVFSMPIDSKENYPYTQEEYLEKLRLSKFGLCLAGYGNKCNREIEYMALGVVPICTEDVDMTHYLVPPREGIHYFRATTPEQVKKIIETCTPDRWRRMSAACCSWWRKNASTEGLFQLTWARIEQCKPFAGLAIPSFR